MHHKYCKAYKLRDLRQFSGWTEQHEGDQPELSDDDVCYLWDDFTVVNTPIPGKESRVLFATVMPEWQEFCTTTLQFAIPEDLRYAYSQDAGSAS